MGQDATYVFCFQQNQLRQIWDVVRQNEEKIDDRYPSLKPLFQSNGLLGKAQTTYPVRTSIDKRGEQSINRDAKTPSNF